MIFKIFINLIITLKMFINFIGNIFYPRKLNIIVSLYIVNVTLLLTSSYIYTYKHCTWRSATAVKTLVQECCENPSCSLFTNFFYMYQHTDFIWLFKIYIKMGVDVVEWSRALDVRLSEWCCSVTMVWVQIPSREEQKFDSFKI